MASRSDRSDGKSGSHHAPRCRPSSTPLGEDQEFFKAPIQSPSCRLSGPSLGEGPGSLSYLVPVGHRLAVGNL